MKEECSSLRSGATAGSRRSTRAQVAPDWTSTETLALLNEMAAVERDCRETISSFQKWKMISENCRALGFKRSLDECRRKWGSLLEIYTKVKELGSYWNLDEDLRKELGVSDDDFNLEVFKAMDERLQKGKNNNDGASDTDTEPDAGAKNCVTDDDQDEESSLEKPIMRKKRSAIETVEGKKKIKREEILASREENKLPVVDYHNCSEGEGDEGQVLAEKLLQTAGSIEAIVKEKLPESNYEEAETDFVRDQGDRLVACLGNLVRTLEQLCEFVQQ